MADNQFGRDAVSRRKFIAATGVTGAAAVAGCLGSAGGSDGEPLTADGSSTVYPITSDAASYWNSNHPADDGEYWGSNNESTAPGYDEIDNPDDKNLADYWAGLYGFESDDDGTAPPFPVNVGLSHSGTGLEKVANGQVDIGDASAPVSAELPDASQDELDKYKDHVVARDGQPISVSKEIYDAGVTKLTGDQVRQIYTGEITNWSEISSYSGPDKEIQAVGRAVGSGTDTAFRKNLLGDPEAEMPGVDVRKGQNQQVQTTLSNSDNAIAYLALAFINEQQNPAIALELDGTTYELGENLGSADYPLSRDLHCYTYEGTSKKEAAFINMLLSEFGQQHFVKPNDYFMLPPEERKKQRNKLPDPEN